MRLRAWLGTWWAWPILASSLFAIIFAITFAATVIAPGPTAIQLFVTRDVSRPATVRLILKTVSLPPLGVSSQTCDGIAFRHGFPIKRSMWVSAGMWTLRRDPSARAITAPSRMRS
jgi:hypothetical protein